MSEVATKQDLNKLEERLNKRFDELLDNFEVVAENIHQDVAGANTDEISLIKQKQENLEERVRVVEGKVSS